MRISTRPFLYITALCILLQLAACGGAEPKPLVDESEPTPNTNQEPADVDDLPYELEPDNSGLLNLTSIEMSTNLGIGWNLGNALEALDDNGREETLWGNPIITQRLLDGVEAAGFSSVRLPVAWSDFADPFNYTIRQERMDRVTEVVDYVLNTGMSVVMNIHWDGGWMQPTYEQKDYVNERIEVMWTQIARHFQEYDERLLFAGTNEVMVTDDYSTPTKEYYSTQNSFNQAFVDAVRLTGGRNAYRHLVVQGFNTNIDHTVNFAEMPTDSVADRLLMEVHFYDPFQFTLDTSSDVTQWGNDANPDKKATWDSDESHVERQFQKMQSHFVDNGIGVILGEYGVEARESVADHEHYRILWNETITRSALEHGMAPMYWDNGYPTSMGLFNRSNGSQAHPELIRAIIGAQ